MLSVDMTGDMEMELDKISRGESDGNNYLNEYKKLVIKWVEQIKNSDTSAMTGNTLICPLCGKPVIKKKSAGAAPVTLKIIRTVASSILQMRFAVKNIRRNRKRAYIKTCNIYYQGLYISERKII